VTHDLDSPAAAADWLAEALPKVSQSVTATLWLRLYIIALRVDGGDFDQALALVFKIAGEIDHTTPVSVRSFFYQVRSSLDRARGDFDSFYANALLFLSTTADACDPGLARNLCVSALCSPHVFSFDELAAHSIIRVLEGTESAWLMRLIFLMERGQTQCIADFQAQFVALLAADPQVCDYLDLISMKVRLSVLQELIFQRPFEHRVFEFGEISGACAVARSEVEPLVLKALASGLLKGFIDEVDERVVVTWCKPKALSKVRLTHLKEQIDRWVKIVHEQKILMEMRAQPVIG